MIACICIFADLIIWQNMCGAECTKETRVASEIGLFIRLIIRLFQLVF
jgi:hypothetical protein